MQYRQHCFANLSVGTLLCAGLGEFDLHWSVRLLFALSFVFSSFLLSPDLDIYHSSPSRNWGYLRRIWWPYTKVFKHRGISHVPLLGTCTRFVYFLLVLGIFCFVIDLSMNLYSAQTFVFSKILELEKIRVLKFFAFLASRETLCLSVLAGAACADLVHLAIDIVGSIWKRL